MLPLLSAPRERRMPGSSTIWPELQRSRSSAVGGFMSTVRTADPESLPHRYATSTPASSKPTRSSSTHHKWLFTPFDCCALVYRQPELARATHTQDASYLDVIHVSDGEWNPTDYAYHLTRRARGLSLWFSLAVYGLDNYREAIETAVRRARDTTQLIKATPHLELIRGAGSRCGAVPSC